MPRKALKPCKHPGCPNLTDGLYCAEHQPLHPDRPSAAKRGYGSRWQRLSKAYLRRHPLCVRCKSQGRFTAEEFFFPQIRNYFKEHNVQIPVVAMADTTTAIIAGAAALCK